MKRFEIPMCVASLLGFGLLSGVDAPLAYGDFTFGEPVNLRTTIPVIDPVHESPYCFSYDGLEMYVVSDRPDGLGDYDICVLKRDSIDGDWGPLENLGPAINSPGGDGPSSISGDGLTLYFSSPRPDGYGNSDIWMTTRATKDDAWGPPVNMGAKINSPSYDNQCWISPDGLELYVSSLRSGGYGQSDIWVTRRATTNNAWGDIVNLGPVVNSPYNETEPYISPDGLVLLFNDWPYQETPRLGGYGGADIWMTRRANLSDPWQAPVNLGPGINGAGNEGAARISPDGSMLYFFTFNGKWTTTSVDGTWDNWQTPIIPIVDLNGDGKVDGKDLLVMIMQLGGDDALCDIGPYAWGDGVVDAEDLKVLAEHIGEDVEDPTLVAHWAFDETEGSIAVDSAGGYDGSLAGGATWQPEGGMVGGALKCDGVTGCMVTDTITDLGTGPFSVVAWVKGGAPGQIILSHKGTTDWLMANPVDGSLMTKLTSNGQPLAQGFSDVVITDGKWHRIALVWDGTDRILYADGKEVARDAQSEIAVADGEFMIGASIKPGTLWSGLIDDVRIYSRVVRP